LLEDYGDDLAEIKYLKRNNRNESCRLLALTEMDVDVSFYDSRMGPNSWPDDSWYEVGRFAWTRRSVRTSRTFRV